MSRITIIRHTTDDEVMYIRKQIGLTHEVTRKLPRREMLEGYMKAYELRTEWDNINKDEIFLTLRTELAHCA